MDLGIAGRKALVIGASQGLGFACARALAAEGVDLVIVSRRADALIQAAEHICADTSAKVDWVAADAGTEFGRASILMCCPDPDILINNIGGPSNIDFRQVTPEDWSRALDINILSSVELIRATIDSMLSKGFGRIVNVTSLSVRMPLRDLNLATAARLALIGYVSGVARQVAPDGVTINNLLPGTFATERLKSLGERASDLVSHVPIGRAGDPAEFGATCAFLCSNQAAYMTAQNILVDGGVCSLTL